MAEQSTQTQKSSAPASTSPASSDGDPSNAGSESQQPTNAARVDTSSVEDKGKSAASDEQDGADSGDGVRQRPGRQERRINELTQKIKELEATRTKSSQLQEQLQRTPIGDVTVPDFTNRDNITYEDYKKDVITAASQIVDLKLQTTANVLESKIITQNAAEKAAREIETAQNRYSVLNPDSEDYDEDLVHDITENYGSIFAKDPSFSFAEYLKPMSRFLQSESNTKGSNKTATESESNKGTAANRAGATSSRKGSGNFDPNWSTERMEEWFASKR